MSFPETGDYVFPEDLAPVSIDRQTDRGSYWEPNVWMGAPGPVALAADGARAGSSTCRLILGYAGGYSSFLRHAEAASKAHDPGTVAASRCPHTLQQLACCSKVDLS